MVIERKGKTTGRWPSYSFIVDGVCVGMVRRVFSSGGDRMQPSMRDDAWQAGGRRFETRELAEAALIERAKAVR